MDQSKEFILEYDEALKFCEQEENSKQKYNLIIVCYEYLYDALINTYETFTSENYDTFNNRISDNYDLEQKLYLEQIFNKYYQPKYFSFVKWESEENMFTIKSNNSITIEEFKNNWNNDFALNAGPFQFYDFIKGSKDYHDGLNIHRIRFIPVN